MKERPILFSTPMVQAILEQSKNMTRRLKGLELINKNPDEWQYIGILHGSPKEKFLPVFRFINKQTRIAVNILCPYGQPGDVLWVKETFFAYGHWTSITDQETGKTEWKFNDLTVENGYAWKYMDNPPEKIYKKRGYLGWYKRPSIFMPKAAARIWLEITDRRVERLQEITTNDALKEGVDQTKHVMGDHRPEFMMLWESINGQGSWDNNPWVWVVQFKVVSTTGKPQFYSIRGNRLVTPFAPGNDVSCSNNQ